MRRLNLHFARIASRVVERCWPQGREKSFRGARRLPISDDQSRLDDRRRASRARDDRPDVPVVRHPVELVTSAVESPLVGNLDFGIARVLRKHPLASEEQLDVVARRIVDGRPNEPSRRRAGRRQHTGERWRARGIGAGRDVACRRRLAWRARCWRLVSTGSGRSGEKGDRANCGSGRGRGHEAEWACLANAQTALLFVRVESDTCEAADSCGGIVDGSRRLVGGLGARVVGATLPRLAQARIDQHELWTEHFDRFRSGSTGRSHHHGAFIGQRER